MLVGVRVRVGADTVAGASVVKNGGSVKRSPKVGVRVSVAVGGSTVWVKVAVRPRVAVGSAMLVLST